MTDTNVATKRTAVNVTVLTAIIGAIYELTGWELSIDMILPLAPVIGVIAGAFYRLSRVVADKWPAIGYVLFGSTKTPTAYVETKEA